MNMERYLWKIDIEINGITIQNHSILNKQLIFNHRTTTERNFSGWLKCYHNKTHM